MRIDNRLITEVDLTAVDPRKDDQLELLYPFTKEGFKKGAPAALRDRQDATSRFLLAALLLHNDSVRSILRRELRRVVDVNVTEEEIVKVLEAEVVKRDALEGPPAEQAAKRVKQSQDKSLVKLDPKKSAVPEEAADDAAPALPSAETAQDDA